MGIVSKSNREDFLQLHGLTDFREIEGVVVKENFITLFNEDVDLQGGYIDYKITAFASLGSDVEVLEGTIIVSKLFGSNDVKNVVKFNDSAVANKLNVSVVNGSLLHIVVNNTDTSFDYFVKVELKIRLLKEEV